MWMGGGRVSVISASVAAARLHALRESRLQVLDWSGGTPKISDDARLHNNAALRCAALRNGRRLFLARPEPAVMRCHNIPTLYPCARSSLALALLSSSFRGTTSPSQQRPVRPALLDFSGDRSVKDLSGDHGPRPPATSRRAHAHAHISKGCVVSSLMSFACDTVYIPHRKPECSSAPPADSPASIDMPNQARTHHLLSTAIVSRVLLKDSLSSTHVATMRSSPSYLAASPTQANPFMISPGDGSRLSARTTYDIGTVAIAKSLADETIHFIKTLMHDHLSPCRSGPGDTVQQKLNIDQNNAAQCDADSGFPHLTIKTCQHHVRISKGRHHDTFLIMGLKKMRTDR
ncbi:uncharacterized protein MYCFIDRAFT_177142 [Pseudocercospora fijiensis CIRAD86]|uniref:Uncharacterized protein n=1 Tax=Pseudocercospora fijiensis (strain CIRAD86) TaxID=383855 RepID=M2ZM77_PSEFD|nr:uncharacterized protein MYCFIDRAFT_177142 [Pseudocercospora fijiensis CIRAD86]EME80169.1 hypothetical protein MYCFIDRAFT_177142 [Pseudocercospora fijiensis CIRAD86]